MTDQNPNPKPDREKAWRLLCSKLKNENLRKHCLAVEATMKHFAQKFGRDEKKWAITGLLHDIDWEETKDNPEKHAKKGAKMLKKEGYPDDIVSAVKKHNHMLGLEPETLMEKTLWAIDELTGLIVATALVHPNKLEDVDTESVMKKMDDTSFAKNVERDIIRQGAEKLDLSLEEMIEETLEAMKGIKDELGL